MEFVSLSKINSLIGTWTLIFSEYQRTVATLIHGELNGEFLNCGKNCPKLILVNDSGREHLFFNSIEELSDIEGEQAANIYKVFSGLGLNSV